jgi:hypothetical protein
MYFNLDLKIKIQNIPGLSKLVFIVYNRFFFLRLAYFKVKVKAFTVIKLQLQKNMFTL